MFKTIAMRNFRCFSSLEVDLTGPRDAPLRYAAIYGANASGKTSIVESVRFLQLSAMTFRSMRLSVDPGGGPSGGIGDAGPRRQRLGRISLRDLVADSYMVGAEGPMELSFRFSIGGKDATYSVGFSDSGEVLSERLRYVSVKGRAADLFSASADGPSPGIVLSDDAFPPSSLLRRQLDDVIGPFWGRHTLLALIVDLAEEMNRDYVKEVSPRVAEVTDYITGLNSGTSGLGGDTARRLESNLAHGWIAPGEAKELDAYRAALDRFFARIDRDADSVEYDLTESSPYTIEYTLCFNRLLSGKVRRIPFHQESTGVRKLVDLFPMLLGCAAGKVTFVDEMDSGVHDKLMHDMMVQILPDMEGQLIFTTHNTSLLRDLDPHNVLVIDTDMEGNRSIASVNSKVRTRGSNNNQVRYARGDLGGVPFIASVGMRDILDRLREDLG